MTLSVLANDSDVDGDPLTVTGVSGATGGTAVLNPDGTVTFTPTTNFNGQGSFSYTVSDGQGGTASATARVTVTPVNDAPVAVHDAASTASDSTATITLTANDSDPDGDTLSIQSVDTTGLLGTVTILDGDRVLYDPNGAFAGLGQGQTAIETFSYTVTDSNGGTSTASVAVTVGGVNGGPIAVDDTATVKQGRTVTLDLAANDSDPNGDALAVVSTGTAANGTVTLNPDGTVTYDSADSFFGTDSFQYTVLDGRGGTDTATATITVERNLTPRLPEPVVFFAPENQTLAANLQAIDPEGDPVTYSIVGGVDAALFSVDATTGELRFLLPPDFELPTDANLDNRYIVRMQLADAFSATVQTVTINVTDVADTPNRAPVVTTNGGQDMRVPLLVNQSGMLLDLDALDLDGDTLAFRLFGEDADKFSIDQGTGQIFLANPLTNRKGSFDGDAIYELDVLVEDGLGGSATIGVDFAPFTAG